MLRRWFEDVWTPKVQDTHGMLECVDKPFQNNACNFQCDFIVYSELVTNHGCASGLFIVKFAVLYL